MSQDTVQKPAAKKSNQSPRVHPSWDLNYGIPPWIPESKVPRGEMRVGDVFRTGENSFTVAGRPDLGDEFEAYFVVRSGNLWACSCHGHNYGRARKFCSHTIAARIVAATPETKVVPGGNVVAEWRVLPKQSTLPSWRVIEACEVADEDDHCEEAEGQDFTPAAAAAPAPAHDPLASLVLPSWCPSLRPHQQDALRAIYAAVQSGAKNIILEGPTGAGKSLVGYLSAQMLGYRANYICSNRSLQKQFLADYESCGAVLLEGKSNYPTADRRSEFPNINCGKCDYDKDNGCSFCQCSYDADGEPIASTSKLRCPYVIAKRKAEAADLAILNTAYALSAYNFPFVTGHDRGRLDSKETTSGFRSRLSIYDEADELESSLRGFVEVEFSRRMLSMISDHGGDIKPLPVTSRWKARVAWLKQVSDLIKDYLANCVPGEDSGDDEKSLANAQTKIETVLESIDPASEPDEKRESWVYVVDDYGGCSFRPVMVRAWGRQLLFNHSPINLIMSATIVGPELFAADLGLELDGKETVFVAMPSTFPKDRRPILVTPIARMSYKEKATSTPKICAGVVSVINRHPGHRALIHSVSYDLTRDIKTALWDAGMGRRIATYSNAGERESAMNRYLSTPGGILVAPSMERGIDLRGDHCRIVIIPKIPFPSLGDPQISRRRYQPTPREGELWYSIATLRTVVQMTGRGMRSADDWCWIYILDAAFVSLYRDCKKFLQPWFTEAVRTDGIDTIRIAGIDTS